MPDLIRIGILGAASIAPWALVQPAQRVGGMIVHAVAARDPARAAGYAQRNGIPHVYASYDDLLADPALDAVYIPLPNSLHAHWTLRALEAGKHVLCEKPLTSNAAEAQSLVEVASRPGAPVLMEAFHNRYHPLVLRMREIPDQLAWPDPVEPEPGTPGVMPIPE